MTHAYRPTTGNTAAIDRFNPNGPKGYAPVYNDGTHGPTYATRDEAEKDYARKANPMKTYWQIIDNQLDAIETSQVNTFQGIADIMPGGNEVSAAPAFFGGSGGDRSLFSALMKAGWTVLDIEASYHYAAIHPGTGEVITYIEGDIYPGNRLS